MAFATLKFNSITVFFIVFFTNPFVCLCRCSWQESEALLSLNISSLPSSLGTPWTNGTDCCEWNGITCNQDKTNVVRISLSPNDIRGGVISDSLCKLPFLTQIYIWNIGTTGTLPSCLEGLPYLHSLNIDDSGLSGVIPLNICMLTNLISLSLKGNQLSGSMPFCLNNISSLRYLDLSENQLSGQIPFTWGNLSLLQYLDVSFNRLSGTLPLSFVRLSSLTIIKANGNRFNESTPSWAIPSSIERLYFSLNHELTISETLFHNLTNLWDLSLSNCTLNISTFWIPNFQLSKLEFVSCQMDGQIPPWISTQFSLKSLTLVNNDLIGEIPSWLWAITASVSYLNLSRNHLHGSLFPNGLNSQLIVLDVSHNEFSGYIPSVWPRSKNAPPLWFPLIFLLNDNLFTGNIPQSFCNLIMLKLHLENNKLDGMIPWCLIEDGSTVQDLNLGGNSLEGRMPEGLTVSSGIRSIVLTNNQLSGTFLPLFRNNTALQALDIGHNKFTGHLPKSVGNISALQVLAMKDNQFSGNILSEIGNLKQLQILDLSSNNLSGSIPYNIICLQAMTVIREDGFVLHGELEFEENPLINSALGGLDMNLKGSKQFYPYILSTLISIDISNNQLIGDVPLDFGKLKGLMLLNLSMNNLGGVIPHSLGDMKRLESLDLSSNRFSGNIPTEFQSLNYLAYLNLSNNNLSGSIPQGGQMITFENASYSKNPYLQGCPLPKNCSWPKFRPPPPVSVGKHKDEEESKQIPWYQIGVGWSYGAGFLFVVVLLISIKERWKKKYFKGVDNILKPLFPFMRNRRL